MIEFEVNYDTDKRSNITKTVKAEDIHGVIDNVNGAVNYIKEDNVIVCERLQMSEIPKQILKESA